jgi:tRNA-uridine 2-sulfurtransferase
MNFPSLPWQDALRGRNKVVIGMSGGVDSSVAAWRLKEAGLEVVGLFMKNWEDDDDGEHCTTRQDFLDAAAAAEVIGIELQAVNFAAEYKDRVFAEFLREYQAGRTPNPDVLCNAEIKFKAFLDHALATGAQCIATGHYAQIRIAANGLSELIRAADSNKDQTYFLHRLNQAQLSKTVFPIGDLQKPQVRELAKKIGLPNAAKKDSTGICFIGERPFREFLNRYVASTPGPMKTPEGRVVGKHMGLAFYTLGQRKGLGIGGDKEGDGSPWFVLEKDLASNTLVVAQGHDHPALMSHGLTALDASWVAGGVPGTVSDTSVSAVTSAISLTAKTRYRQADAACTLADLGGRKFSLRFAEPQWAVTPGQSAVLYQGEICLGGGIIEARCS